MKFQIDQNDIYVTMTPGDLVVESLTGIAKKLNIASGWISGIGAIEEVTVGMYHIDTKVYDKKQFNDEYELLSFQGNISLKDGSPFVHAHIAFSDSKYNAFGGHLFETKIYAAGEFVIHKSEGKIERKMNHLVGLPLWCLDNE